jgi:hypothetical protein
MLRKESMSLRAVTNGMFPRVPPASGKPHFRTREWIGYALYVICSLYLGIALLMLPWQTAWENNYFIYIYPQIRPVVTNSFFKGAVLGLGIVNIMIGIQEIVRLRKSSKDSPQE